jgi:hypothetical protein
MKTTNHCQPAVCILLCSLYSTTPLAAIPAVEDPSAGSQTGLFAFGSEWIKDLVAFGVPTVLAFIFLAPQGYLWVNIA